LGLNEQKFFYAQMLKEGTMKKQTKIIAMLTIVGFLLVTWLPCQAGDVLCGCVKIKKGALRIIDCSSQCLKSEYAVTLSGGAGGGGQTGQLACVTAAMAYDGQIDPKIQITNQKNITVNNWSDIFDVKYSGQHYPPLGDDNWGLLCKDDWVNTGCSHENNSESEINDTDTPQVMNGCFSDDEELANLSIFVTCCKIVN
jgi:hypothetical protein